MQTIMHRNCFKCDFFWFFLPPLQKNLQTFYTFLVALTWAIPSMAVKRLPFTLFKIEWDPQVVATCHRGTRASRLFQEEDEEQGTDRPLLRKVSFPFYSGSPFPLTINSQAASFHTILGRHESEEKPRHWHLDSSIPHFPDICLLSATSYTLCFSAGSPTRSWWPSQWETWTGSWRCAAWTGTRSCRWSNGKLFIFFSSHEMHRQNCVSCHFLPFSKESDLAHFVLMVEL